MKFDNSENLILVVMMIGVLIMFILDYLTRFRTFYFLMDAFIIVAYSFLALYMREKIKNG